MGRIVDLALRSVAIGEFLDADLADEFMNELMNGRVSSVQLAGLISAMAVRGEQPTEIVGFARAMRRHAIPMTAPSGALDTCGTGGDGADTFNISTTVAIIAAAAGIPVAKHGNRAASSLSGSADVLQKLGARIDLDAPSCEALLEKTNLCFLFAPVFHPAMKHAATARKELGFRTIFNILGPLTNPARTRRQVLGVFRESLVETVAQALAQLGVDHAMVVHGAGGLDELSISGPTTVAEVRGREVLMQTVAPEDVSLSRADVSAIRGGDASVNAEIVRELLRGKPGARRDVVVLNAAAALYVGGKASDLQTGAQLAKNLIDSGTAYRKLTEFIRESHTIVPNTAEVISG
ncbi:anthranilate phosphoribosyltransferase [Alicyclobacillus fastidiosus]|uniref:Anthranilate phosphoribosyltransferase n=1 Tax=Alicyclobacillus fastidiosus TaxID=392011 RepID=A0ABY6Z9V6_9BACL|nr:anthranilate phosphoribosyltransferase [Alicyclobacillus fastidiosus]WAH39660.1 anthranilate phosphoribosyltransferase [Alicyclobacillus fastidiosus]GMA60869.1 anthranilate phosphoribosyltransferase [Alicyclobacillus fastidiosus]